MTNRISEYINSDLSFYSMLKLRVKNPVWHEFYKSLLTSYLMKNAVSNNEHRLFKSVTDECETGSTVQKRRKWWSLNRLI